MEYKDLLKYSKLEKILAELIEAEKLEQKALQNALLFKTKLIEKYGEDYTRKCTKKEGIEHCDKLLSYNSFLHDVKVISERHKRQARKLNKIIALHEQAEQGEKSND